jgi:hypothetical protein
MPVTIIENTHPDYLKHYYEAWGAGQSLTSRQEKSVKRSEKKSPRPTKQEPQQEADTSQPSDGGQEDHPLANTESGEE